MTVFGMLRIKNEGVWIEEVINSILPACERIWVFDDHSTDSTPRIWNMHEKVTLIQSPFEGLDESRDKNYLLQRLMGSISDFSLNGNADSPYWALCIDGDEVLAPGGADVIGSTLAKTEHHAFKLPIRYLWNDRNHVRVDGVYRTFARPSIFRIMNRAFTYQKTPWGNGANFHCSSIPQELLGAAHVHCPAPLLHLGYINQRIRARKFDWYNRIDPNNKVEDGYRHITQGDPGGVPANETLKHAGPLQIVPLESL